MNNNLILKALELGATDFDVSEKKDKRFYVIYDNKNIHFGAKNGKTFIDHKDQTKKNNWYARHSKIKNKNGQYVINLKTSPSYWSANLLW
jgi:hypothetical protein